MSDAVELSMDELHSTTTDEIFKASAEEKVIKTGKYITKVPRFSARRNADDAEFNPGRENALLTLNFYEEDGRTKVGDSFTSVSWEARYTKNGKLDAMAKRFVELYGAVNAPSKDPNTVLQAATKTAFMTMVRETYIVSPDDLHSSHLDKQPMDSGDVWIVLQPDDDDEREHYLSFGYEPKTMIDRFYKIR